MSSQISEMHAVAVFNCMSNHVLYSNPGTNSVYAKLEYEGVRRAESEYTVDMANGGLFKLASGLARRTGNNMITGHAERTWNWRWNIEFIDHTVWQVYRGSRFAHSCISKLPIQSADLVNRFRHL